MNARKYLYMAQSSAFEDISKYALVNYFGMGGGERNETKC
jgi:hypothetical protein